MFGKRKKQKEESEASAAALVDAFAQLDLFGGRLDELKQSYNDQAKELAKMPTPVPPPLVRVVNPPADHIPTPAVAFYPPLVPSLATAEKGKPEGRYSSVKSPQTVPRSNPPQVKAEGPKRTRSGRFYLQLAAGADTETLRKAREQLSKFGRVVDSGKGTASDPDAGWIELAVREEDTRSIAGKLEEIGVREQVDKVIQVSPGEGRLQARQFDLFRKKADSSSGSR